MDNKETIEMWRRFSTNNSKVLLPYLIISKMTDLLEEQQKDIEKLEELYDTAWTDGFKACEDYNKIFEEEE